jgi:hypothetical protein
MSRENFGVHVIWSPQISRQRENSYAFSDEEMEFGIRSLAVAVRLLPPSASVHHPLGFGRPI